MSKQPLHVILCAVSWDAASCSSLPRPKQKAIAMGDISPATGDPAQPSSRGEVMRRSQGSLDFAGLSPWAVLNKRMFLVPESLYGKI